MEKVLMRYQEAYNQSLALILKSKAEFEFFKIYFRGHYAEDFAQSKNVNSDFVRIGKEFHRWFRDNSIKLGLKTSNDFIQFANKITYFANTMKKLIKLFKIEILKIIYI